MRVTDLRRSPECLLMNVLFEKFVELQAIEEVTNHGDRPNLERLHGQRGRIYRLFGTCHEPFCRCPCGHDQHQRNLVDDLRILQ